MDNVIAFPTIAARAPAPEEREPFAILRLMFGGSSKVETHPPEMAPEMERATLLQAHLRHVHDLIEWLGPAEAMDICLTGYEVARNKMLDAARNGE